MKVDPPLLNRFEKQIVSFKDSLNEDQINLANKISDSLKKIKTFNNKEESLVYNLPELLINCSNDEIEGLIYKICNNNPDKIKDEEFIEDEIFKRIAPTFCQDIIASVKYSGFDKGKNAKIAKKIIKYYKEIEINNFSQFLEKSKKDKSVIFTFSSPLELVFPEESNYKYKEVTVDSIDSENKVIEIISNDQNLDYLIFRFVEKDLIKMNHISYLINNYETKFRQQKEGNEANNDNGEENEINTNSKNTKKKKKVIFLVHLIRKSIEKNKDKDKDKKKKKKQILSTEEIISNLDDTYEQYFIDNLKSERNDFINILDIKDSTELLNSIIDFDKFLDKNLNKIMSYFDYNLPNKFSNIKLRDYSDIILTKLIFNKENANVKLLRDYLIDYTKKNMNQKNMIPKVYTSKVFQNTDIDFFQVLATYMLSELSTKLLSVVTYIEKRGFFSSILVKENNDEIIQNEIILRLIKNVFERMDIYAVKMPEAQLRANKINVITELSIPCSFNLFNGINVDFILKQKINEKYIKNENTLRPRKELENERKSTEAYLFEYNKLIEGTKEEFSKNEYFREIFSSNFDNLKKALFYDYLKIYCVEISEKLSNKDENILNPIDFIELLLQMKFNIINADNNQENEIEFKNTFYETKEEFNLLNLAEIYLFLECYKGEIIFLVEVFCSISSYLPNTLEKIKEIIKSKIIINEESDRNPRYKKRVNEIFYIIIESILKSLYINKEAIYSLEIYRFYPFFDSLKSVEATFNRINQKFLLYSNELYSLRNLLSLYDIFKNESDVKDIIKNIMGIVELDNEYLYKKQFDKLKENILKLKQIISDKYGKDSDKLADYMSNLLRQQYKKIDDENKDYKYELLTLAFETDKLIERSMYFLDNTIRIPFPQLTSKKKEECEKYFLSFISKKKDDKIYSFYENIKSEIFTHVLLYYFELVINNYFNEIVNKHIKTRPDPQNPNIKSEKECEDLVLNINLLYLKKALNHLDNVMENKNLEAINLNNLGKIYSIAYIKLYIKHLAEIYFYSKDKLSFQEIINTISGNNETNTRKVIKIFFFKNCLQFYENYSKFNDAIIKDQEFPFRKEYKEILESQTKNAKPNYFLNEHYIALNNYEEGYAKDFMTFTNLKNNKFDPLNSLVNKDFIDNNGLDILYCLLINHLISYFYSSEKEEYLQKIEEFKKEFAKISNSLGLSQKSITLLNKLVNVNGLIQEIIGKQRNNDKFTQEQFEIILHSLRFVLQSSQFNENNFYNNLISEQSKDYIDNNYIPGALPFNNLVINSYYTLNELLRIPQGSEKTGFYVCTCGQWYTLGNCTCPSGTFPCNNKNCKLQISGEGHKLLGKEAGQTDHWRVILTEEDKNVTYWSQKEIAAGKIPCIFLEEYKKRYVDKYLTQQPKGITKEEPVYFMNRYNQVRTLDELSFRILNYLLYSHLFFSNLLGYLSDENLNLYTHGEFTCIRLVEKNWEIIQTILTEKGINNIKIFMNIIFDKIKELMKNIEDMSTIEKRQEFETNIKEYIDQLINNQELYTSEESKYNECNEKIKGSNPQSLIEIISENYSPFSDLYNKEEYPNLGLFLLSKYPDIKELETCLGKKKDYTKNYCLLNQVLICNEDYGLIENVVNINKLVNLLYKKYNNKIERDKAKTKKILECFDENENLEDIKKNILTPYINSWNNIKAKCTNYLCRPTMPVLTITMENTLNNFLPDDGELYGGMYLASAYKFFIDSQNEFVKTVIKSIGPDSLLRSYLSQLNQEIHVHEANEEDVVKINSASLKSVKDMIFQYSMRDIFKNGKIDFKEFKKSIKFDFDSIENELARKILPGVKLFVSQETNEPIQFISYLYETFRSNRSSIITNYNLKYPPRILTTKEEELLYSFIKEKKAKKQNFYVDVLASCQILIDFIQKENFNKNKSIVSVIRDLPKYIEVDDLLKSFFIEKTEDIEEDEIREDNQNNNNQMYSINTLINIYELIEFLCWESFKDNLNDQYKIHLTEDMKKKINKVIETTITENSLVKKQDLANATRRLVSRYLSGKRGDTDIDESKKIFDYIQRSDLWKPEFMDNEDFGTELFTIFDKIRKEINFINKCGGENICEECIKIKAEDGDENPCLKCDKCNPGLIIGHAMEFYELINEEILDLDKFLEKKTTKEIITTKVEKNEIITEEEMQEKEEEINTSTKQVPEDNRNDTNEINNENNGDNENQNNGGEIDEDNNEEHELEDFMLTNKEELGEI